MSTWTRSTWATRAATPRPSSAVRTTLWRRPSSWLIAVAVLHAASPLLILGIHWGLGIDESVYLSQLNAHVPAGGFSAPRARGSTLVAAPVTLLTSSLTAIRIWTAALSGVGMYLGFRPWLTLRRGYAAPLAALLLSSLWVVTYYGDQVMPNEWVAFCALAATGYALRFASSSEWRHLAAVITAMGLVALLRPSDAVYAGFALCVCCVFLPGAPRVRLKLGAAVLIGAALGAAEWVIEAWTSFGGLGKRVHDASGENGGSGLHFAGAAQARALAGPILCRNGCHADSSFLHQLWWIAMAVLLVVAVVTARRRGRRALELVPVTVGLALAAQYVFTVTYAAPRFLIPAYALLSLPCASAVLTILAGPAATKPTAAAAQTRGRTAALAAVLVVVFLAHSASQVRIIQTNIAPPSRTQTNQENATARALTHLGLRRPCIVLGNIGSNQLLAYLLGCTNAHGDRAEIRDRIAAGAQVAWFRPGRPAKFYGVRWRHVRLPGLGPVTVQYAYLSVPMHPPR